MKSLEDLERIRREAQERIRVRDSKETTKIVVAMGTCGIAAGARDTMAAILDEIAKRRLAEVQVVQTGCVGLCEYEPMVDVAVRGQDKVTYTYVDADKARQIIARHVVNGQVIGEWVLARS
ncbi:MAG: (2Fe-2S) ferredoxin domain-containing protein [Bacillota bacterium]